MTTSSLIISCCKEILKNGLPKECIDHLENNSVVYLPVKIMRWKFHEELRTVMCLIDFPCTDRNRLERSIPKERIDIRIIKYHLNMSKSNKYVYLFDTEGLPFVTNDVDYFLEMYSFHKEFFHCEDDGKISSFRSLVDDEEKIKNFHWEYHK